MNSTGQETIVVGVDGSAPSKAALRWALRQAQLTDARLHAVVAWEFPAFYSWEGGPMPPEDFEQAARESMHTAVDEVLAETEFRRQVDRDVRHGHSAQALLEAASEADLLVVGSRGHGSFYGALLGSTSQRCVIHAKCPVVVVRD